MDRRMKPGRCSRHHPSRAQTGHSLATFSPLKEALETEAAASAVVEIDGQLFQMVAVPVLGPDVIGFLMLGQVIDDSVAARLKQDTHSDVTFLTASRVFASSWPGDRRSRLLALVPGLPAYAPQESPPVSDGR